MGNIKKYFIKIDRESIKVNPNAYSTKTVVFGKREVTFKALEMLPELVEGKNCFIYTWTEVNGKKTNIEGYIFEFDFANDLIYKYCKATVENGTYNNPLLSIEMKQDIQNLTHSPIQKYSYKYENIELKCNTCGDQFMSNDIQTDDNDDGGYSTEVCPKCGAWDCCDIKYENINDIKK